MPRSSRFPAVLVLAFLSAPDVPASEWKVGVARVDITPSYPVRLSGFGFRRTESEGVHQKIWAKALAFEDATGPSILLTVDNLGVPAVHIDQVRSRLGKRGIRPERVAVTSTHTHTAPMLADALPTLFGVPIPKEHQANIARYTQEFLDNLERAALAALEDRKPAKLTWGVGKVDFAINRRGHRTAVDHNLPLLVVRDLEGKIRALHVNYACHCVTLSHNRIGGDWAGDAQVALEADHPGCVALVSIGCGADSNPSSGVTGDKVEISAVQGRQIASEVRRMLAGYLAPVTGPIVARRQKIDLPLAKLPTEERWKEKAERKDAIGYHAHVQLAKLARGEALMTKIEYEVSTWSFGTSLAMVFLPGEVVADYSLRLARELDPRRLWINAYSNGAPCYIPSERVLKEGGYEGGGAMVYYDVPVPFAPGLEGRIISTVHAQIGKAFAPPYDPKRIGEGVPLSPQRSHALLRPRPGLTVDLVAAEPLVASPVAIDFGPDGRLWVCEMYDYPSGLKGKFEPGGRVRVLEDTNGDGIFDRSTIFLDGIPFPTGITVWRKGVLVCAAPDILYAEDTKGNGRADVVEKLYSGFGTDNYQGRVNSLCYGLDGWVYGSCGLFGGRIRSHRTGKVLDLGNRDFRIRPDTGAIEPATGRTQQGLGRDDRGNWFGCDNSNLCWHLVVPDQYLRRNPRIAYPGMSQYVPDYPDSHRVYPSLTTPQLFKLSGPAGRVTAGCGLGVYRDDRLGEGTRGDIFVCEPVNHLVHRMRLSPRGSTFSGRRVPGEESSEFLASTDGWHRPVQSRTGPDGALWVVDMYRYMIEHPRWVPAEDLARIDVRAGAGMGRIYRVRSNSVKPGPLPRLDRLDTAGLVAALDSPNGVVRDLAGQMLLWRNDATSVPELQKALGSERALTRLHALTVLEGLGKLQANEVGRALTDADGGVRRLGVRQAEQFLPELGPKLGSLVKDSDAQVRLQLACSLGACSDPAAARALVDLIVPAANDPYLVAAVSSSLNAKNVGEVIAGILESKSVPQSLLARLPTLALAVGNKDVFARVLARIAVPKKGRFESWQFSALASMLDAADQRKESLGGEASGIVNKMTGAAREIVRDDSALEPTRLAAMSVLGRSSEDLDLLSSLLSPRTSFAVQSSALSALGRSTSDAVPERLLPGWKTFTPTVRVRFLDLFMSRPAWQRRLLTALEKKEIPPGELDATRRQGLLEARDPEVRRRAAGVFTDLASPDRRKVLAENEGVVTLKGDASRGKAVFARVCATCHRLDGVGHIVGPDLAAQANKTPRFLLQEILDPNRNLDSRFTQYTAVTQRGQTFVGLLASETATSVTLRAADGKQQVLLRADLEELIGSGKSLMPEGLEKDLSRQDLADVISYVAGSSQPAKPFLGNAPAVVKAEQGAYHLLARSAAIHGGEICFETPFANIGMWHGVEDHVLWTVMVQRGGKFDVWLDWSCDNPVAGNPYTLEVGAASLRGKVPATGGWHIYEQRKIGSLALESGTYRVVLRPDGQLRGALLDLRGIHLVPAGAKPVFASARAEAPKDVRSMAALLLDDKVPATARQKIIDENPDHVAELISAMVADLKPGTKEEYRRIPWLWRVTVAAGKRNDAGQLKKLLAVSLPVGTGPLHDWQAVVVGGGIINGISMSNVWPRARVEGLVREDAALKKRWKRALDLAGEMADAEKVPTGTRYDALRMIALAGWDARGKQLTRYLARGTHPELTMGAISGLSDIDAPEVAPALLAGLAHFTPGNRKLAIDALLRNEARTRELVAALEKAAVQRGWLAKEHMSALIRHPDRALAERARKVLEAK